MSLENLFNQDSIARGIGIDLVSISGLRTQAERGSGSFLFSAFTDNERKEAERATDSWSYFAGRFAVKEAVFKAVAHLLPEKSFDFRIVETLYREDGSPEISVTPRLRAILDKGKVSSLEVSISNEGDYAVAFVVANSGKVTE